MSEILIVWLLGTGSLFAFNCSSPFNRSKLECIKIKCEQIKLKCEKVEKPDLECEKIKIECINQVDESEDE